MDNLEKRIELESPGMSRRTFLKATGLAAAASLAPEMVARAMAAENIIHFIHAYGPDINPIREILIPNVKSLDPYYLITEDTIARRDLKDHYISDGFTPKLTVGLKSLHTLKGKINLSQFIPNNSRVILIHTLDPGDTPAKNWKDRSQIKKALLERNIELFAYVFSYYSSPKSNKGLSDDMYKGIATDYHLSKNYVAMKEHSKEQIKAARKEFKDKIKEWHKR